MYKYILKRLLMLIPVLIGVFTIAFILNQMMPGDPARQLVGETATEEAYQSMREPLGLNRPLIQQYFHSWRSGHLLYHQAARNDRNFGSNAYYFDSCGIKRASLGGNRCSSGNMRCHVAEFTY